MKKILAGVFSIAMLTAMLTGCNDVDEKGYLSYSKADSESSEKEDNKDSDTNKNAETTDWKLMEFSIDSVSFVPKFDLSALTTAGWSFNPDDYSMGGDFVITPGLCLSSDVYLHHEGFDDGALSVGLTNTSNEDISVMDAQVWALRVDIKDKTNYPSFSLPGNIQWHAAADEIKSAFGEPNETNRNDETMCTELKYNDETGKIVHYYVYDDGGMMKLEMEQY